MDREINLVELLQRRLSRRDLFRNAGVAGIGLSALWEVSSPRVASAHILKRAMCRCISRSG